MTLLLKSSPDARTGEPSRQDDEFSYHPVRLAVTQLTHVRDGAHDWP